MKPSAAHPPCGLNEMRLSAWPSTFEVGDTVVGDVIGKYHPHGQRV